MKQILLSLIGKDKPGLVEQLSNVILANHGNWLNSNLSYLAGHFAGIVQIEVSDQHLGALTHALSQIPQLQTQIEIGDTIDNVDESQQLDFVITGNDRPGIVQELAAIIRHKGANIVSFSSSRQTAPNLGIPLFHAVAKVQLPVGLCRDDVVDALESLTADLIVDIEEVA